jgi:Flp pilus assembly protein TadD
MADVLARIGLAAVAAVVAAGFALQIHAHNLLASSKRELAREFAGQRDPAAHRHALDDALEVADLRPGSNGLFPAIGLAFRGGNLAQAERYALRAARREPDNFAVWVTLAVVRQRRGDSNGAAAAYAQADRLNPLYRTPQ